MHPSTTRTPRSPHDPTTAPDEAVGVPVGPAASPNDVTIAPGVAAGVATTPSSHPSDREPYLDLLRAGSLLVVVLWHWVFTVLSWQPDGPRASNPIGHTPGLWLATWVLQVMPAFFFVGGYVHLRTWRAHTARGGTTGSFLRRRLSQLMVPAAAVLALAAAVRVIVEVVAPGAPWVDRGLVLLVSPLWFLAVYLVLVVMTPWTVRAHERLGWRALVGFVALAIAVDVARFAGVAYIEWCNFVAVFGFVHQLGFWWEDLVGASRRRVAAMGVVGLGALVALTTQLPYPRSMVGVPGEALSNLAPPTICILALATMQVSLVLAARDRVSRWLTDPAVARVVAWLNTNAMALFLWHFTGYAIFVGLLALGDVALVEQPDARWWAQRPVWFVGPALCTVPLLTLTRRLPGTRGGPR